MLIASVDFGLPYLHENKFSQAHATWKFPGRAHAENKLSDQTKFDRPPPPRFRI